MLGGLDCEIVASQVANEYIWTAASLVINELVELDKWKVRKRSGVARFCRRTNLLV